MKFIVSAGLRTVLRTFQLSAYNRTAYPAIFHRKPLQTAITLSTMSNGSVTAGIVIIGDEIIKGQVQDSNSFYLCQRLHQLGVQVRTVVSIPDDLASISKYVNEFSSEFTYVITAGGIGPTHDDITYEAIADAFGVQLKTDDELENIFKTFFKEKYTDSHKKLATVPENALLVRNEGNFPIVNVANVFILPGVPKFLNLAFSSLEKRLENPSSACVSRTLYMSIDEMSVAKTLTQVNAQFAGAVSIGSYPEWRSNYYKLKIILESKDCRSIDDCEAMLRKTVPSEHFLEYNANSLAQPMANFQKLLKGDLQQPISEGLDICTEALQRYKLDEICIGFNGGKDCTALLHLWYAVASQHSAYQKGATALQSMYIRSKTPFPEVELFIEESIVRYNLKMMRFNGGIKEQLIQMKAQHPNIKAVIMGTRATDPSGRDLSPFKPTGNGWPELMRINPILNFTYNNVWQLLRGLSLPYCSLYDVGYTSLGSVENTHVNPALRYTDDDGVVHYRPAYTLAAGNHHLERAGRHS